MPPPGPWSRVATPDALRIVRDVIAKQKQPIRVQELFKLALQEPCTPPGHTVVIRTAHGEVHPPHDHAIRSMRYLKQVVLPTLVRQGQIEQKHLNVDLSQEELDHRLRSMNKKQRLSSSQKAVQSVFAWTLKAHRAPPKPKPVPEKFGKEVGVGEDWSHLNRRRQGSRKGSVSRDVAWMKELAQAREAAAQAPLGISQ